MTVVASPPAAPGPPPATDRAGRREVPALRTTGAALTLLGTVLLTFLLHVTVIGQLRHHRAQQTMFAEFRMRLAETTAPVGQGDDRNKPLAAGTPVAVLQIKSLDVWEVVVESTTSGAWQDGPGHRRDTVLPGQRGTSVIMGRRAAYGGPFTHLPMLRTGDAITVTTGQGTSTFRVRGLRRPGDPIPPPLGRDAGRLTLITADGTPYLPTDVLYADADLVSTPLDSPPRLFGSPSLPQSERAMQGDDDAWVPMVGWLQLLVIAAIAVSWASSRWGARQAWVVGVPLLAALGLTVADEVLRLLPNLL